MATQIAEFGMDVLRVTQGPHNSYSHSNREAVDFGGANYGAAGAIDKWYARGCSWVVMFVQSGGDHFVYFQTTEPVLWADGVVDYAVLALCHQDVLTHNVGQIFKPGDLMYIEGTYSGGRAGAVSAHVHCQVGRGKYTGTLLPKAQSYKMPNEAKVQALFFVPDDVKIADSGKLTWVRSNNAPHTTHNNAQEDNDMYIKVCEPVETTPRSSLIAEGWVQVMDSDGKMKMYNPDGSRYAREVAANKSNLSSAYEDCASKLNPGEILIAVE